MMRDLSIVIAALSIITLIAVPQLRRCMWRSVERFNKKEDFYNSPNAQSNSRWGKVNDSTTPDFRVTPEQIEDQRALKKQLPSRFVAGQSFMWTILFYLLSYVVLGCIAAFLISLKR